MKLMFLVPLVGAVMLQGSGPGAVHVWKSSELHSKGEALAKKLDANKVASEPLLTDGNRIFSVSHREGSGQSEVHDTETDIMFFVEGQATITYGGTVIDGKTTAPGQTRGSGITGGTDVTVGPGDVLTIPAKIPHQMKLASGAKVTYFVTKVVQ
jgi:mannose-6-phosphate isomerase-like protein (cupin superfamily)